MDIILGAKYEQNIFVYLDNVIIVSSTLEHHIQLLREVRDRLAEAALTIILIKCEFFKTSLKYLGYIAD